MCEQILFLIRHSDKNPNYVNYISLFIFFTLYYTNNILLY